ncbi:MAG: hypothetical protein ACT4N8_12830 [Sphingosinicella sp.]|uniref:hypothetical protein n=1 Tax=Sphingosinicella sp. TaxID=1917971 RepID=UPI004037E5C8
MLLAALAFAQAAISPTCGDDAGYGEVQRCEIQREAFDVLDAASRPAAATLGEEAIRFSYGPAMPTGRAIIVELVPDGDRNAAVRFFWLSGNREAGWQRQGRLSTYIPAARYRQAASTIDHLLRQYELSPRAEDGPICLDGPEYRTERVRNGQVVTLEGWCPRHSQETHPNPRIAGLLLPTICPHLLRRYPNDRLQRRDCDRWRETARQNRLD